MADKENVSMETSQTEDETLTKDSVKERESSQEETTEIDSSGAQPSPKKDAAEEAEENTPLAEDGTEKSVDTDEGGEENKRQEAPENIVPEKPVKRARTAYFIFAEDKRPQVQKEHPGEGVAVQAKALGELWSNLNDDEKKVYQGKAALEREQVAKEMAAWLAAGGVEPEATVSKLSPDSLTLPVARIRKICKLDPDVKGLSKEALMLVTKAVELFTVKLGAETVGVAQIQNRRKLLPDDIAQVCSTRSALMFLQPDIQDLVRQQVREHEAAAKEASKSNQQNEDTKDQRNGSKPLTDFFAAK